MHLNRLPYMTKAYLVAQEQAWNCCPEQPCQVEALSQGEPVLEWQNRNTDQLNMLYSTAAITIQLFAWTYQYKGLQK